MILSWAIGAAAWADDRPVAEPPPISQESATLREVVRNRLPPDIRLLESRSRVEVVSATYGDRLVERIQREGSNATDWLELEYTIVPSLQERIRTILDQSEISLGHVVVMDPQSGDLFAYLATDPKRFPATRAYPAASLMKVVTAAAVLRHAPTAADRECRSSGSPYRLEEAHLGGGGHDEDPEEAAATDWVGDFRSALAISNNQCFGRYAVHDIGRERLLDEIARTGLLDAPALGHPAGVVAPVATGLEIGHLGSGLAGSWISSLGAVRLAGLLATGTLVTPNWTAEVRDPQGLALDRRPGSSSERVWDEKLTDELRTLARGVTEFGTASRAFHTDDGAPRLGAVRVAGKTGTLHGSDPAGLYRWFIGVAPAENPTIAMAAVVVHEEKGGTSASAIGASVLEAIFCESDGHCHDAASQALFARADGRELQVERSRREAVAAAHIAVEHLDARIEPLAGSTLDLPRRLLRKPVQGEIVLQVELDTEGGVEDLVLEASNLPADFDAFVLDTVRSWRFTPPRRAGRPVSARARLALPIRIQ